MILGENFDEVNSNALKNLKTENGKSSNNQAREENNKSIIYY
jgi:hypothetical protein